MGARWGHLDFYFEMYAQDISEWDLGRTVRADTIFLDWWPLGALKSFFFLLVFSLHLCSLLRPSRYCRMYAWKWGGHHCQGGAWTQIKGNWDYSYLPTVSPFMVFLLHLFSGNIKPSISQSGTKKEKEKKIILFSKSIKEQLMVATNSFCVCVFAFRHCPAPETIF